MRGDHHVEFADRLTCSRQLVSDLRVVVGGIGAPGQHLDGSQKLLHTRVRWVAGIRFNPYISSARVTADTATRSGGTAASLASIAGDRAFMI